MGKQLIYAKEKILQEIEVLPEDKIKEVIDFIGYLKTKSDKKSRWETLCKWGREFAKRKGIKKEDIIKSIMESRY